jgi:hypothetical protein
MKKLISNSYLNLVAFHDWLIGWCLMPALVVFQLYRGMNKFYNNLRHLQDHAFHVAQNLKKS